MLRFEIVGEGYDFAYENAVFEYEQTQIDANDRLALAMNEAEALLEAMVEIEEEEVLEATTSDTKAKINNAARTTGDAVKTGATKTANGIKTTGNAVATPVKAVGAAGKAIAAPVKAANAVGRGVKKASAKAVGLVKKISEFVKNLFARLIDTLQTWFQNSGKWLEARKGAFGKFSYDSLEIAMVPYWEGRKSNPIQRTSRTILQALADVFKTNGVSKEELEFEGFVNRRMKEYVDAEGDLIEGMKNFYRVGNAKGKDRFNLEGSVLKNMVLGEMIPSITNYQTQINEAQNIQRNIENRALAVAKEIDNRETGVTESALFKVPYNQTDFAMFEDFDYLMENAPASSDNNRTQVAIGKDVRTKDQKNEDEKDADFKDGLSVQNTSELKVLTNVLKVERMMMSCYFTVMQERYTAYMNALKAIWSAANNEGGRNKDFNGEGKQVGKDKNDKQQ